MAVPLICSNNQRVETHFLTINFAGASTPTALDADGQGVRFVIVRTGIGLYTVRASKTFGAPKNLQLGLQLGSIIDIVAAAGVPLVAVEYYPAGVKWTQTVGEVTFKVVNAATGALTDPAAGRAINICLTQSRGIRRV
jgi:hypothetical protein